MKSLFAIVGILLLATSTVYAKTAKELRDACTSNSPYLNGECDGYIEAIGVESNWLDSEHPVLSPWDNREEIRARYTGDYTLDQMKRAFIVYISAHPEEDNHPASSVLFLAWLDHKIIRMAKRGDK